MICPDFDDVSAYADGELAPAEHRRLAEHFIGCKQCRATLARIGSMQRQLHSLPSPVLGYDLAERFNVKVSTKRRSRSYWPIWMPAGFSLAALAAGAWLGASLVDGSATEPRMHVVRVFDPIPPGGLCAIPELCRLSKEMP